MMNNLEIIVAWEFIMTEKVLVINWYFNILFLEMGDSNAIKKN